MNDAPRRGRIDWASAAMALATALALAWFAWARWQPPAPRDPPKVGAVPPPLRLLDPSTDEPLVLLGLRGKVVWITFWSADAPTSRGLVEGLIKANSRLHVHERFSMVAVAAGHDQSEAVRAAVRAAKGSVSVYRAAPETLRAYGAVPGRLPLHVLIDDDGQIGLIAQGADAETLERLTQQAKLWLDALEPLGSTHFAARRSDDARSRASSLAQKNDAAR